MAAYAALLSLRHIIEQLQHHPFPPICLDQNQIQSLTDNLNFLQEFLEQGYPCVGSSKEALDVFESRIADAAHAAEDMIETRVVDQILAESTAQASKDITETWVCDQILGGSRKRKNTRMQDRLRRILSIFRGAGSSRSPSTRQNAVAGLDVVEKISSVDLKPWLVLMGGIGKTTLARNSYAKPLIVHHFDVRAWVTISQNYHVQDILIEILLCVSKYESRKILSGKSEGELSERVHKSIWGRRYLIVLDDIWSVEVWDRVQIFFPDNGQGSRVMITTRLSNVVFQIIGSHGLVMDFLNEYKSWELLRKSIFEKQEDCPLELEEIGKKIAKNCKGLPLSIVVIGGLLAKSKPTREYWEYISENLNSILHLEENERCLKVLHLSYNHLPVHLKPCFLYMGVFPEDKNIRFLKSISGKSLEAAAREYLEDLCDRNLILVHERGLNGGIKFCKTHDLVRELCLREAEKEKFLYTLIAKERDAFAPSEIWKMTQLRHVQFNQLEMPDPPLDGKDEYVLGNLRTLSRIRNFKCGEEVVKRIPNIKKLQICYHEQFDGCSSYCLDNLVRLHKLESFGCFFFTWNRPNRDDVLRNFILPNSLKKLTLHRTNLYWEDMKTKIGLLPNLQVLKLKANSFVGTEWETVEGQFCNLKFLQICDCSDLERWTTESAHFPRLEQLDLRHLDRLEEIPSDIGEIPTLQSIRVQYCSKATVISARRILDEQEEFDNVGLRVRVVARNIKHFESLASPNFQVEVIWMN
ncbi:hypothetical protein MIMGU_mgv1a001843mg [Erythranthe guttata]|uniref:Uncharacterized protein n=1 Tax=Erythranthe guttata TaxID=4155 RepID=A0A022QS96_ERYGU|nr:hypothetical protein MIMGU_mgv1a001843mg [Erythranthe guttata]